METQSLHDQLRLLRQRVAELEADGSRREELLRETIEAAPGPLFLKDKTGRYLVANRATAQAFGLSSASEVEGRLDTDLASPEISAALIDSDRRVEQTGLPDSVPYTIPGPDGQPRHYLVRKSPRFDATGQCIGIQGSADDLTEPRERDVELRDSEHNPHSILESISDGFFAIDRTWRATFMNRAAELILDLRADQVLGRVFWEVFPGLAGSPFEPVYRQAMDKGEGGSVTAWYPDHQRWYEATVSPYSSGIALYFRDVTDNKRADEALRESNMRFELAQRATGLGTFDWNIVDDCSTVTPEWRRIYGYPDDAPMPTHGDWVRMVHPEDRSRAVEAALRAARSGVPYDDEFRVVWPDGSVRWVKNAGKTLFDKDGQPSRFIGTALDVTERKQTEAALERQLKLTRAITDNSTTALFITDEDQKCVFMNPAAVALTGFEPAEVFGKALHPVLHHTRPDGSPYPVEECPINSIFDKDPRKQGEEVFIHKDGHFYEVAYRASPMSGAGGLAGTVVEIQDITETKRREAERRRTENLLEAVLDALPVSIIIAGEDGRIIRMNRASERIWGSTAPLSPSIGNYAEWIGYRPGTNQRLEPKEWPLSRAVLNGEVTRDERIEIERFGDGQRLMLDLSAAPVLDEAGQILGGVVASMDVTDRVEAEQAVRASEATLRAVLDALPVGVLIADRDGRLVRDNAAHRELWGAAPETTDWTQYGEWVGFWPHSGKRIEAHEWAMARALLTGETIKGELVLCQPFGSTERRSFLNNAAPVRDSEGRIIAGVAAEMDVTERMRAEEAVRSSEEEFRTLANAIPQLCWMAHANGHIFWYNQRWFEYTGTVPADMEGWGWTRVHDPAVLPEVTERWTEALRTGSPFDMTFPLRGADGLFRPFLTRIVPVRDASGRIARWFGTNTDISEQKRTEDELRRANQDLEQFAYSASHDLQEPLRNTAIYSQLLMRRYAPQLDGQAREFLGYLVEGAHRMGQLVTDLLSYTQAARFDREPIRSVNSEQVLEHVLRDLSRMADERGAAITHSELPAVRVNPVHLQQLFQNLVGNALKYSKDDDQPRVHIAAEREQGWCAFSVRDNGIGIDRQYHDRIFGIFKRLHGRHGKYPGTGIGLAICQKIVERYGGRIWVESELGAGTTFWFTLPEAGERDE